MDTTTVSGNLYWLSNDPIGINGGGAPSALVLGAVAKA